jgi:pimeloyl-ACP methyl ester carboxylesterase
MAITITVCKFMFRRHLLRAYSLSDSALRNCDARPLLTSLPDARLLLYPDSGHGSHFQFSEEFAEEAARFFAAA